ncbi:MAG: type IV secretion system DNA-binding domain-containing protein [Sedimenticola sp.]
MFISFLESGEFFEIWEYGLDTFALYHSTRLIADSALGVLAVFFLFSVARPLRLGLQKFWSIPGIASVRDSRGEVIRPRMNSVRPIAWAVGLFAHVVAIPMTLMVWTAAFFLIIFGPSYVPEHGGIEGYWGWFRDALLAYLAMGVGFLISVPWGWKAELWVARRIEPRILAIYKSNELQRRESKSDIRTLDLPETEDYDPRSYYKKGQVFLGKKTNEEDDRPIYIDWDIFRELHVQLMGTTGSGKGVTGTGVCAQVIRNDGVAMVLDPKGDKYASNSLRDECEANDKKFSYIDLECELPQFNLFQGASEDEIALMLEAGFDLSETGSDADFYRAIGRRLTRQVARIAAKGLSLPEAYLAILQENPKLHEEAPGFALKLEELARLPVINTSTGIDFQTVMKDSGCLYVVGSEENVAIQRLQKMLLIRWAQIIKRLDRVGGDKRHVTIFMDEFKVQITAPALSAIAMIRSRGANVILAHQSLADLEECSALLNPAAVRGSAVENTSIKVIHRVEDPDTAAWVAAKTGTTIVEEFRREANFDHTATQRLGIDGYTAEVEKPLVDTNTIMRLPARVAVIFTPEGVNIGATAPYPTEVSILSPKAFPPALDASFFNTDDPFEEVGDRKQDLEDLL